MFSGDVTWYRPLFTGPPPKKIKHLNPNHLIVGAFGWEIIIFFLQNCKIRNPRFHLVCQSFWVWGREDVNQRQGWLVCASHFLSTCFWIQFHPLNPVIIINFSLSLLILETWILHTWYLSYFLHNHNLRPGNFKLEIA